MKPQLTIVDASDPEPAHAADATDADLVSAIAAGDVDALGLLFDAYQRTVYAFLSASTGITGTQLDDLVQDTFVAVLDAARRYSRRAAVKTWLLGIALNVARGHLRREKRRRKALGRVERTGREPCRPDDCAAGAAQLARLPAAIAALSPKLRQAYVACVVQGLNGDEASAVLGVRKGTVWRRVHEARRQLRTAIGRTE